MDICNALWRKRAFSDGEANEHGCLVPRPTLDALARYLQAVDRTYELTSILNFSYSPTLSYLSLQRIRELEDQELQQGNPIRVRHAGPVTEQSLLKTATAGGLNIPWLSYRINVLDSLTEKGLPGIADLLKCTMTRLKKDMETR
jgi:centromere protein I